MLQNTLSSLKDARIAAPIAPLGLSPDVVLSSLRTPYGNIHTVRDDLLQGGTKQRAAIPFLKDISRKGYNEFVYASPFAGFAQIALAASCKSLGFDCKIFCEEDRSSEIAGVFHPFSNRAASFGAKLILDRRLEDSELRAQEYCQGDARRFKIPLGFNSPVFCTHLKAEIDLQWWVITKKLGFNPKTLWLPVGSGTLANAFRDVLPSETSIKCVNVHVLQNSDLRMRRLAERHNVIWINARQEFINACKILPPIPSNMFYDAKLWEFILEEGRDNDVWWNVAR